MSTHIPVRTRSRSKYSGVQCLIGALGAALFIFAILIGLEVSVATARSGADPSVEIVNRAQKGDHLPLMPALNAANEPLEINIPQAPAADTKLVDGCEPLVSPLTHSRLARVAGRCVS